jgi:hypothetical protein
MAASKSSLSNCCFAFDRRPNSDVGFVASAASQNGFALGNFLSF